MELPGEGVWSWGSDPQAALSSLKPTLLHLQPSLRVAAGTKPLSITARGWMVFHFSFSPRFSRGIQQEASLPLPHILPDSPDLLPGHHQPSPHQRPVRAGAVRHGRGRAGAPPQNGLVCSRGQGGSTALPGWAGLGDPQKAPREPRGCLPAVWRGCDACALLACRRCTSAGWWRPAGTSWPSCRTCPPCTPPSTTCASSCPACRPATTPLPPPPRWV